MPVTRTLEFLPAVFQTDANKKFLNATLDQLLTEPSLNKINGFIGRKFAPTATPSDSYIKEPTQIRQKYQLEPGVVVKNSVTGKVEHHSSYPEILQKLRYYGSSNSNQNSIWESEYYTFNPHIDLDKFINFAQYYWLPNGPSPIDVYAGTVDTNKTFTVTNDIYSGAYNFTSYDAAPNPDIILARGGTYEFVVDQPGRRFWIQSSPGISGTQSVLTNLSSREVYGVTNNGEDSGTVTFSVPQKTDQDFYVYMPSDSYVDLATDLKYSQIQGVLLSDIKALYGGIDGQYTESVLTAKYLIFNGNHSDSASWTANSVVVPANQRMGIWRVFCQGVDELGVNTSNLSQVVDYRVVLTYQSEVTVEHKVQIKTGNVNGGTEWYRTEDDEFNQVPALTAILDTLYYQDSENPAVNGIIRLVDAAASYIDVTADILGKTRYTSPNGVTFSNGMKICFDSSVTPTTYANKEFYVEGVGSAITLTELEQLGGTYDEPDYIVINRSSLEKSQWAQGNRWFHSDIINLTAMYNNTVPTYDLSAQARRPIIEFEPNLQLFNFGSYAKVPVDLYDTKHDRPFNTVEGVKLNSTTSSGFFIDGVELTAGMRIIFAADQDSETRNNIWVVSFITVGEDEYPQIHLTLATDGLVQERDTVLVQRGTVYAGAKFWYTHGSWVPGQQKSSTNVPPRFDVFDSAGISFGNQDYYPVVTVNKFFTGTELFSYAVGTGADDEVLGFPLTYRNVGNIGDIVYENDYDIDVLEYTIDRQNYDLKVNTGRIKKNNPDGTYSWVNNWSKVVTPSRQLQEFNFVYSSIAEDNVFVVDVLPKEETLHPTLYVYLDGKLLSSYNYYIEKTTNYNGDPINGFRVYINSDIATAGNKVDVFVDSDTVSEIGGYELPSILELNAQNATTQLLSLSEMRNHVSALTRSSTRFSGKYPGASNLRDLDLTAYRGLICQQSANVPLAMMCLTDETINLVDAIRVASREYSRFKNRFLENASKSADIAFMTPAEGVDAILKTINASKNKSMPWYYSDMVPVGESKNTITYNIFDPRVKTYEITSIAPMNVSSNQSVLAYYNGVQLVRGRDYTTSTTAPTITISDAVTLEVNGTLTIVEYANTDGCFVPETPSKMGLYPKFTPEVFVDETYVRPLIMIRGHDGSTTPAFTPLPESGSLSDVAKYDFRDLLLLELEKRIFNNIKVAYDEQYFGVSDVVPGKFRNTGYSLTEFNSIISRFFLSWVGANRLDYLSNSTYDQNNLFTWNYRGQPDKLTDEELPGSWRACYEYYYDTQTPHLTPWEMLGFSIKPDWWEDTYGPAPYTGGNLVMWQDLANGYIAAGERQGVDPRFVRPELMDVIPVDDYGTLKSPTFMLKGTQADFVGNRAWSAGSFGPVESAWRNSSEYPYAAQVAMAIAKPGKYFGVNVDKNIYNHNNDVDQYINRLTNQRLVQTDIVVNGETGRSAGYMNWIADNLRRLGINPQTILGAYLSNYEIKLVYHMAGFSDKKYLKILAEQYSPSSTNNSVLIPDSDYDLVLTKTTPIGKITYSAVIVEKTTTGYRVSGYDTNTPVFTMIPPDTAGQAQTITILDETVNIFKDYRKVKIAVPYGFEFTTPQQVSNFLIGYGLNLASQGFRFDEYDQTLEHIKNWTLSVKEFLFWAQQGWKNNSIIVLSPVGSTVSVNLGNYDVDKVSNTISGGRVLNQNFQPIGNQSLTYSRLGNRFTCNAINQDMIGLIDLNLVQYEHTIMLNNISMFNDVIYKPENGIRQYRLKLVGNKTADWNGSLFAAGFIYHNGEFDEWVTMHDYLKGDLVQYKGITYAAAKDLPGAEYFNFSDWIKVTADSNPKLLPNFAHNSSVSEHFYDVDSVNLEDQFDLFGKGLIGYRNRNYLYNLGLDDVSQVKFYQGYIKEKGTLNAFSALGNVSVGNNISSAELSEEWAFRVGEYGALDINQTIDLEISEKNTLSNPFTIELSQNNSDADIVVRDPYLMSTVDTPESIFLNRNYVSKSAKITDIQTAGFPELSDVDYTLFDIRDFGTLKSSINNIGSGTKIWCAKDFTNNWNVFRVVETNISVTDINNALDGLIEVKTNTNHGLNDGDVVLIKNAKQFSSLYKVIKVPNLRTFVIEYPGNLMGFTNMSGLAAPLFTLKSMVFDYAYEVAEYQPLNGWKETDVAWIRYDSKGKWGTYKKITPWNFVRTLPRGNVLNKQLYGTSVNLSVDNQVAMVGNPSASSGKGEVVAYTRSYANRFRELAAFSSNAENTVGLGQVIEQGNDWSIIGAPASRSSTGYAFIALRTFGSLDIHQVLVAPDYALGAGFGTSVTISQDDMWACVGAPGAGKAYLYGLKTDTPERSFSITGKRSDPSNPLSPLVTTFILNFVPESIDALVIRTDEKIYLPYIDYTITGAVITFTVAPALTDAITISQSPGYRLIDTITGSSADKFGYSVAIATDGAQILSSAPYEDVTTRTVYDATELVAGKRYQIAVVGTSNFTLAGAASNTVGTQFTATTSTTGTGSVYEVLVNAGSIYVYDRSVESFVADGGKVFSPLRPTKLICKVTINDVTQTYGKDYVLTSVGSLSRVEFVTPPPIGAKVSVETNEVNLIERVTADEPAAGDLMGYNINLCPTNCSIYAGVPMRTHKGKINCGAVIRYFNTGRQSGTNIGVFLDPVSVQLFESAAAGTYTLKVQGNLNSYPDLRVGLRVKSSIAGLKQFATITNLTQTASTYFTITVSDKLTDNIDTDTEIVFERVPRVVVGSTIRINDFEIEFAASELDDVVNAINAARIPGITAYNANGYLELVSDVLVTRKRLRCCAGKYGSAAIHDLGLRVYPQIQFITNPYNNDDKYFGKKVRITRALPDYGFLVGSDTASTYVSTTFDSSTTTLDNKSTNIHDRLRGSGAVYMFTYMGDDRSTADFPAGKLTFAQQFVPATVIPPGLHYGTDFDIQDNSIIIGAPEVDVYGSGVKGTAQVYEFVNPTNELGWTLTSFEDDHVDIDSINKFFLWNKNSNLITSTLDYIDPAKGKILGIAEQEITYKTAYDPAMYNQGDSSLMNINEKLHWTSKQVGQVWWDLSKVRYIDYEHGSLPFRAANWGLAFPGSTINVYEWVESLYLPSDYVANGGNGTPLYPDNSAYVTIGVVDTVSNREYNKYYYWVTDKNVVDTTSAGRNIPISLIKELIENPRGQNIKFAAAIKDTSVALFNCADDIKGDEIVLHIDYDTKLNSNIIHSEWQLVKENVTNGFDRIPEKIFNKILDSLCGLDNHGNVVPDPLLPVQNRYGINVRPRQGIFIDQYAAVESLVKFLNGWFKTVPLALSFNIAQMANSEPVPPENSGIWSSSVPNIETLDYLDTVTLGAGYKVLVENDSTVDGLWTIYTLQEDQTWFLSRVQSYDDSPYWSFIDWYATGFDETVTPKYVVKTMADLSAIQFVSGDIVKVLNDGTGNFRFLEMLVGETRTVGLQNGTVKFNDSLYDLPKYGMGWNNGGYGMTRYDQNPSIELRQMLQTLFNRVLVEDYQAAYGKVIQILVNYILTEQKSLDWMFKTNFVSVLHKLRKLTQPPVYSRDNQETYLEYLEEVKPYSATIREYVVNYEGVDNVNGYVTDFDVPPYYDSVLGLHRGPSGEYSQDAAAIENVQYYDWKYNYAYGIPTGTSNIVLVRPGKGYTSKPTVTITGSGTDSDAVAEIVSMVDGQISGLVIVEAGTNYTGKGVGGVALPPKVEFSGGGLPSTWIDFAQNLNVEVDDILKTDTLQYFKVITAGTLWAPPAKAYEGGLWLDQNVGDLVWSGGVVLQFLGEDAIAKVIIENTVIRKILPVLTFDRVTYGHQTVNVWRPSTAYHTGDIIYYRGTGYKATTNFVSPAVFTTDHLEEYYLTANDRIGAFYQPAAGAAGNNPALLQSGIDYPGVRVTGAKFSDEPGFDNNVFDIDPFDNFELDADGTTILGRSLLDSLISSQFTDEFFTELTDTRSNGIIIDGGGFVDTYSSHAPEELIPGRVHEALDIQVRQTISPPLDGNSTTQTPDIEVTSYRVGDSPTRTYSFGNSSVFADKLYVYSATRGRLTRSEYTIDYFNKEITLVAPLGEDDVLFIYSMNQVGVNKQNDVIARGTGSQTTFSTEMSAGIDVDVFVQVNGETTTDFTVFAGPANTHYIQFNTAPADGSYIHIMSFVKDPEASAQQWSAVSFQEHVVPGTYGESSADYTVTLDPEVFTKEPFTAQVIVELNRLRLRPSSCAYYTADGVETEFDLPTTDSDVQTALDENTLQYSDVRVFIDGVLQEFGVNYSLGVEEYAGPTVTFNEYTPVPAGSRVTIEVTKFAAVTVASDGASITITGTTIKAGDTITIDSFANHDILGIETRVFVGGQSYTTEIPVGFDESLFDQGPQSYYAGVNPNVAVQDPADAPGVSPTVGFDTNGETTLVIAKFNLETEFTNMNYLWVTLDGRRLMPVRDFVVSGTFLYINPRFLISNSSIITVTSFAETPQYEVISFRQFKDITGNTEYLRMAQSSTTTLLLPLLVEDDVVMVNDPTKLPIPGIKTAEPGLIFIRGERIAYYRNYATETITPWAPNTDYDLQTLVSYTDPVTEITTTYDVVGDVNGADFESVSGNLVALSNAVVLHGLGQIQRGVSGTGATNHSPGSLVVDGSAQQAIPDTNDRYGVALFKTADGSVVSFTTTVPDPLDVTATTVLYITDDQKTDFEEKAQYIADFYAENKPDETPPYTTLSEFIKTMVTVYVGGTEASPDSYNVGLSATTYNGDTVHLISVVLDQPPASGVWVALELRVGNVWFDIGIVDDLAPTTSALAASTTNQAKFLKEEAGFLV